ncbi:MAG: hypothetical protein IJV64_09105 [Oscillospiraceae bacterium]|nr:hypothetical protein [Oscillospiraceae bacterium]
MRNWKKTVWSISLAALLLLSLAACGAKESVNGSEPDGSAAPAGETGKVYTHDGLKLTIPTEYTDLLVVNTERDDVLFSVSEKASIEAANAMGEDTQGAGWLFSISAVSKAERDEMVGHLLNDEIFAKDENDVYYVYSPASDVTLVREQYDNMEEDMKQWTALNEWAWNSARDAFIRENGLTPEASAAEEQPPAEADDLSGAWQDEISQRASMDVTRSGDGSYTLLVHWGSGATEAAIWEITGTFDESGTLTYEDGKYGVYTFDESGSETVSGEETTRGSFALEDGKLRWQDSRATENGHSEGGLFVKFE